MTEKAIEFLQEWISEKVQPPRDPGAVEPVEQKAGILAKECAEQAASAGVRIEDIEEEVGDLEDLIAAKLEDAAEDQAHNTSADAS
ncbi:hypothetical protein ABMA32_16990 [Mesorhizobium sp. VNQ89]|uniref:DUF768 domain-containing protein n=1 Tax=Mesorhizobium quangtriensis TaxID=3157709 RepID=UPI0032B82D2D